MTEVVAPASLQAALNKAAPGETLTLAGHFHENLTVRKPGITIIPKTGAAASVTGRIVVAREGHHFTWERVRHDGRSSGGLPSPTFSAANFTWRDSEVTNGNTAIGFNSDSWDGGIPDDCLIEGNHIHHVGKMPAANHDHGIYIAAGRRGKIRHNLIERCADRGIQVYSYAQAHDAIVEFNLVAYCGQGILFGGGEAGEPAARTIIRKNIVAYTMTDRAGYEEWWQGGPAGPGNVVADNLLWDPPTHRIDPLTGAAFSPPRIVDPQFTNPAGRDFRLRPGSPAVGYGPASIQPGGTSPPPTDRAAIIAEIRTRLAKTTILYSTYKRREASGYYGAKLPLTEWWKIERLLNQLG